MAFYKDKITWLVNGTTVLGNTYPNYTKGDASIPEEPDGAYNKALYELLLYCRYNETSIDDHETRISTLEGGSVPAHTHSYIDVTDLGEAAFVGVYSEESGATADSNQLYSGTATSLSRSDHNHDDVLPTKTELATAGATTINANKLFGDPLSSAFEFFPASTSNSTRIYTTPVLPLMGEDNRVAPVQPGYFAWNLLGFPSYVDALVLTVTVEFTTAGTASLFGLSKRVDSPSSVDALSPDDLLDLGRFSSPGLHRRTIILPAKHSLQLVSSVSDVKCIVVADGYI